MRLRNALATAIALGLTAFGSVAAAAAGAFPDRPIKIVVGYAPGGTTDIVARVIAPKMSERLGQSVLIENKPGAGGNLGAEAVARAQPDGYTIQMGTAGNMTINPSVYASINFDPVKDFAPISLVVAVPNLMVVHPSVPATTVSEFIDWAKKNSGKVNFASSGVGNSPHMTGELFNLAAGLSMVHVAYRGSGPALTDLIGGQGVQVMFDNMPSAISHARSGALRALAVTSPKRSQSAPDIPSLQESGLADFDVQAWFGLFAPAGTPPEIVERLYEATQYAIKDPETRKKLEELGADVIGNRPDEFGKIVRDELQRWAKVVKAANISAR